MTSSVAEAVANLLGDTIDRSRYIFRDGQPLPRCMRAWVYSCTDWDTKEGIDA